MRVNGAPVGTAMARQAECNILLGLPDIVAGSIYEQAQEGDFDCFLLWPVNVLPVVIRIAYPNKQLISLSAKYTEIFRRFIFIRYVG